MRIPAREKHLDFGESLLFQGGSQDKNGCRRRFHKQAISEKIVDGAQDAESFRRRYSRLADGSPLALSDGSPLALSVARRTGQTRPC
jgi:hypothetical protein